MNSASNFFAALDDSGDEGNSKKAAPAKKAASAKDASAKKDSGKARNANNDRNTKGGRGPRPPARDGKRQYDRRSGTGRGKEIKKGGGGAVASARRLSRPPSCAGYRHKPATHDIQSLS